MATPPPIPVMERQLNIANISLALAAGGSQSTPESESRVLFEVTVNTEPVGLLEATVSEIGLPLSLAQVRSIQRTESNYKVPDHIAAALGQVVQQNGRPLWLSFPQPSGYLPVVPWESLLQSRLQVPILRLCYTEVQPVVSSASLDVVVCFSFPAAKVRIQALQPAEVIGYYFDHIPENIRLYTTFHVFADAGVQYVLSDVRARHPDCKIKIYDPGLASRYDVPEQDPSAESSTVDLESPWLLWMRDGMGSISADLVHFFCHGYLGREDGFLCFSQSPLRNDDEEYSRFVGARQIAILLDQVGAWSVAFSSQPGNYSIAGLRLLQDQISRIRPGPVLFHDMLLDRDAVSLNQAYQYAYAIEEAHAPESPAISLYCHPDWAMPVTEDESERLLGELTLAKRMQNVFASPGNTPSWIASGQRTLERSVAQLISTAPENDAGILQSGQAEALKFTADLLQRHAMKFGLGSKRGSEGGSDV
jgi:hypothetical protein